MAKTRAQKEEVVKRLIDRIKESKSVVIANFSQLPVVDDNKFRSDLRKSGVKYEVVKKNLLIKVLEQIGYDIPDLKPVESNIALAVSDDEVTAPKKIYEFSKDRETYNIFAGYLEGELLSKEAVENLAKLPSKEELVAKLLGSLNAPVSGFVNALAGNIRNFVYVLNAIKDAKGQ